MSAKDYLLDKTFLVVVQRLSVIVMLGVFLAQRPENTTAWALLGAVVTDLFHASRNGNGSPNGTPK